MRLKFETNGGIRFGLDVSNNDTLQEIKHNIQINHGFPISSQTLFFNGNIIANDGDLLSAAISDESQISLHIAAENPQEIQFNNPPYVQESRILDSVPIAAGASTQPSLPPFEFPDFDFSSFDEFLNPSLDSDFFHIADQLQNAAEASTLPNAPEYSTQPDAAEASTQPDAAEASTQPNAAEDSTQPNAAEASTKPPLSPFQSPDFDFFSVDELLNADGDSTQPNAAEASTQPNAAEASTQPNAAEASTLPNAAEASTQPNAAEASTQPPLSPFQSPDFDFFSVDELLNADGDSTQPPPQEVFIALKMPAPFNTVNIEATDNETILQLKLSIQEITKIPTGRIVIKDQHRIEHPDDMTLLQSQISDKSEVNVEFLLAPRKASTSSQPAPPPTPTPFYEGRKMSVVLKYLDASVPVEVAAARKVSQLRTMLDAMNLDLPDPYFFIHKRDPVDENYSFLSLDVAEGDIFEIFPGHLSGHMSFKLKTSKPNPKAYFDVETHSDDTILQLKQKIWRNEGIPVDRILIKKNGIEQPDHKTLHACSITSDSGITVDILEKKK